MNRRKFLRTALATVVSVPAAFATGVWLFLKLPEFGASAADGRLERIKKSPNFRNGEFQNLLTTPLMTADNNPKNRRGGIFNRSKRAKPRGTIPSVKCDLLRLPLNQNFIVWFGHSSYFIQVDGKRLLVDPVLSGRASPVPYTVEAFNGTDRYTVEDIPDVDYLFISHDHWDHLDYDTVKNLRPKVKKVICGLGVGADLERWGYSREDIAEGDWGDTVELSDGFTAHIRTARHFSGRNLRRNQTLWVSFVLTTSTGYKIFLGGDGGYGPHFKEIGNEFGGFDLALLEDGQYDMAWKYIHMMPDETLRAAEDLRATHFLPVHNSKFCISNHDWDAPLRTITSIAGQAHPRILTPLIGEIVALGNPEAKSVEWWTRVT